MDGLFASYLNTQHYEPERESTRIAQTRALYVPLYPQLQSINPHSYYNNQYYAVPSQQSLFAADYQKRFAPVTMTAANNGVLGASGRYNDMTYDDKIGILRNNSSYRAAKHNIDKFRKEHIKDPEMKNAFAYIIHSIKSLEVSEDFWHYTCCLFNYANNRNNEELRKKRAQLSVYKKMPNRTDDQNIEMGKISEEVYSLENGACSWFDPTKSGWHMLFRYFLNTVIIGTYIAVFILLLMLNQDASFCYKSNATLVRPGCSRINDDAKCEFAWAQGHYNMYRYSAVRIVFFLCSCIPYVFLYCLIENTKRNLLKMFEPDPLVLLNPDKHKGKADVPTTHFDSMFFKSKLREIKTSYIHKDGTTKEITVQKSHNTSLANPSIIKKLFFGLFLIFFMGFGILSLSMDVAAFQHLKDCNDGNKDWSLYLDAKPYDIAIVLFWSNLIGTVWGFLYMIARFQEFISNESWDDTHIGPGGTFENGDSPVRDRSEENNEADAQANSNDLQHRMDR